jgi:hypothetical protein
MSQSNLTMLSPNPDSIFPDQILFSRYNSYNGFEHQFPGKQDLIRENGIRIRTQHGQITLGHSNKYKDTHI